jgi:hypothetical protein
MVPQPQIDLGEELGSIELVKQNINSQEWVLVLNGSRIERSVVYHHS